MFKLLIEGAKNNVDEKLKSPFWGSMIATWLTWNWEVWYTTIFVSEKFTGNKVTYIKEMYNYFDFHNLFPCIGIIFHWILMPLLLSWFIIIFVTPKISHWFLGKHDENKIKENEKIASRIKSETKILKAEKANIVEKQEVEKIKEKSEEEKWDEEYNKISDVNTLKEKISFLIYKHRGKDKYRDESTRNMVDTIDSEYIKNASVNNLIQEIDRSSSGIITYHITEKGKYFLKK